MTRHSVWNSLPTLTEMKYQHRKATLNKKSIACKIR